MESESMGLDFFFFFFFFFPPNVKLGSPIIAAFELGLWLGLGLVYVEFLVFTVECGLPCVEFLGGEALRGMQDKVIEDTLDFLERFASLRLGIMVRVRVRIMVRVRVRIRVELAFET